MSPQKAIHTDMQGKKFPKQYDFMSLQVCAGKIGAPTDPIWIEVPCFSVGRYVSIILPGPFKILTVCEVQGTICTSTYIYMSTYTCICTFVFLDRELQVFMYMCTYIHLIYKHVSVYVYLPTANFIHEGISCSQIVFHALQTLSCAFKCLQACIDISICPLLSWCF